MISRLCLSDLHLGDARSVLSSPEIADQVVNELATLSGGAIGTLILNGDMWEECVPADLTKLTRDSDVGPEGFPALPWRPYTSGTRGSHCCGARQPRPKFVVLVLRQEQRKSPSTPLSRGGK